MKIYTENELIQLQTTRMQDLIENFKKYQKDLEIEFNDILLEIDNALEEGIFSIGQCIVANNDVRKHFWSNNEPEMIFSINVKILLSDIMQHIMAELDINTDTHPAFNKIAAYYDKAYNTSVKLNLDHNYMIVNLIPVQK